MSAVIISEFRRMLEAKYHELSSSGSNREGIIIEVTADEMDRLQAQMGRDIAIRNLDRTSSLLKSIRTALERLDDESYGVCLHCDEPIAEKRLKAVPWAHYCVGCQEIIDRQQASSEDEMEASAFAA